MIRLRMVRRFSFVFRQNLSSPQLTVPGLKLTARVCCMIANKLDAPVLKRALLFLSLRCSAVSFHQSHRRSFVDG